MNWLPSLQRAAVRVSVPDSSRSQELRRGPKKTEPLGMRLDYDTARRLDAEALRLGVHRADLVRAYIARGLGCA